MPLNVRRIRNSFLLIFTFSFFVSAQTAPTTNQTTTPTAPVIAPTPAPPSAAEVMRARVGKAKAFIAVKNYNAAIYELENIKRETSDQTVQSVINVLLMNSFLEQGDYKRAQDYLGELAKAQKSNKPNATANYLAAAGQVVRGARVQAERYKSLGISTADRNLPKEAVNDVQKMRETLETVVEQSKVIGADKKQTADAMALLEEATNARSSLARDDYDAKRWKNEVADARETLANSQSVILNAAGEPTTIEPPKPSNVAASAPPANQDSNVVNNLPNTTAQTSQNNQPSPSAANVADASQQTPIKADVSQPSNQTAAQPAPTENTNAQTRERRAETAKTETPPANQNQNNNAAVNTNDSSVAPKNTAPMQVGSLIEYATQKTAAVYPPNAKIMRASGLVRVELTVDESGQVAEVQKASGPSLLQRAATDAVKRWRFKPFVRDGEPVRATGFVNFNFSL